MSKERRDKAEEKMIKINLLLMFLIGIIIFPQIGSSYIPPKYPEVFEISFEIIPSGEVSKYENVLGDSFSYKINLISHYNESFLDSFIVKVINPINLTLGQKEFNDIGFEAEKSQVLIPKLEEWGETLIFPFDLNGVYTISICSKNNKEFYRKFYIYDTERTIIGENYIHYLNCIAYYFDTMSQSQYRSQQKQELTNKILLNYTWQLLLLTGVLLFFTIVLVIANRKALKILGGIIVVISFIFLLILILSRFL